MRIYQGVEVRGEPVSEDWRLLQTMHFAGHSLMASGGASEADRGWGEMLAGIAGARPYSVAKGGAALSFHETNGVGDGGWPTVVNRLSPAALRPLAKNNLYGGTTAWSAATTYGLQSVVTHAGAWWASKQGANLNNTPAAGSAWWTQIVNASSLGAVQYPPVARFPILFFGNNDLGWDVGLNQFLEAARYAMAVCSLAEIYDDNWDGIVYDGNYAARIGENDLTSYGTGFRTVPDVLNATATFFLPPDIPVGSTIDFGFVVTQFAAGTIEIRQGATVLATKNFAGVAHATAKNLGVVIRVEDFDRSLGDVTMVVTGTPMGNVYLDWWGVESTPRTIGTFVKLLKLADYGIYTDPDPTDADVDTWNVALDNLISTEFPDWLAVDPNVGWNTKDVKFYIADGVHPNDIGHSNIASTVYRQILESLQLVPRARVALQTSPGSVSKVSFTVAIGDETTDITNAGNPKTTFRMPYDMHLTDVRASARAASTAVAPVFDINKEGVSILSTKLSLDVGEKTSKTAATPPVISRQLSFLEDDAEISIDVDTAGTGVKGVKITFIGTREI